MLKKDVDTLEQRNKPDADNNNILSLPSQRTKIKEQRTKNKENDDVKAEFFKENNFSTLGRLFESRQFF